MTLTPEREKEIRESTSIDVYDMYGDVEDLLAELDRLRGYNRTEIDNLNEKLTMVVEALDQLRSQNKQLRNRIDKLRAGLEIDHDIYYSPNKCYLCDLLRADYECND